VLDAELAPRYTVVYELDGGCVRVGALDGAEIERVYVDPGAQDRGVGDAIMSALESEAAHRGFQRVRHDASPSSAPFYALREYTPRLEEILSVGDAAFRFIPMSWT
jgi:GNAT superfamily N-acetyltransferase